MGRREGANGGKHPHSRGEDGTRTMGGYSLWETPPLAWGGHPFERAIAEIVGNTPTRVGRTRHAGGRAHGTRKHPHSRGEDAQVTPSNDDVTETPPLAWGGPSRMGGIIGGGRNTPTRVGRTLTALCGKLRRGKHPHSRGEDIQKSPFS